MSPGPRRPGWTRRSGLTNLHGDVTLQLPLDTAVAPTVLAADEYGNPRPGTPAARYGWLGAHQRSTETPTGMTLMGVRLYNPTTGRFLQTDPVAGGSCNDYDYTCADPINKQDLDGRVWGLIARGAASACKRWCASGARAGARYAKSSARWAGRQALRSWDWAGRALFSSRRWGVQSRWFGNAGAGKGARPGRLNGSGREGWRIGWSVKTYGSGKAKRGRWMFRIRTGGGYKLDIFRGPWAN